MGEIFRHGQQNLVFLQGGDVDRAFTLSHSLGPVQQEVTIFEDAGSSTASKLDERLLRAIESELPVGFQVLKYMLDPWFRRVWTYQEALLAASNLCLRDGLEIDLDDFLAAIEEGDFSLAGEEVECSPQLVQALFGLCTLQQDIREYQALDRKALSSVATFMSMMPRKCSDLRDHIYGTLGLMHGHGIVADYDKAVTDVFQDGMMQVFQDSPTLFFVCLAASQKIPTMPTQMTNLPSWVVQWHMGWHGSSEVFLLKILAIESYVAGQRRADMEEVLMHAKMPQGALRCRGIHIGTVKSMFDFSSLDKVLEMSQEDSLLEVNSNRSGVQGLANVLGLVLKHWSTERKVRSFQSWLSSATRDDDSVDPDLESYLRSVKNLSNVMYCVHTAQGRIGLASKAVQEGDKIAVLYGCVHLLVLRRRDPGYCLVGFAIIPELMNGEAVERHEKWEIPDAVFDIY